MPTFKYIITDSGAILFNENTVHKQVAQGFEKIYSAGFVRVKVMHREIETEVYGESESLGIKSEPLIDKIIIDDLFVPVSKIKYFNMSVKGFYL
jgi:hypothetical protein